MAINERLVHTASAAAGTGNQEEGLILHLDANDVDSYDGDGSEWVDITNHEYTPATNVSEHFNTVLYTGNGTSSISVNGAGFQPDLIIQKNRDASSSFNWYDSVRGATKLIYSSGTAAQVTYSGITSFDPDGFTNGSSENVNTSNYVAWCFKAGGAPTASTPYMIDGTGYATLSEAGLADDGDLDLHEASINTKLGFAIYRFDPNNVSGETASFEHGLGTTPELVITKSVSGVYNWWTWTNQIDGSWDYLKLNGTDAKANDTITGGNFADATTMRFAYGFTGVSSNHVAYAFTSKRGVSKVGSYVGTGAAGNKVYTGFEPAFILIKATSVNGWIIWDNKRGGDKSLFPHSNIGEISNTYDVDFNSDGFTIQTTNTPENQSGTKIIYYAVAKNTNETSLIPDTNLELHLDADSFSEYGEAGYSNTPSTWTDSSGNSNNGTISGATFDSELGNYLDFDGNSHKVTIASTATSPIDFTAKNYTIELWINPDTSGVNQIFTKYGSSDSFRSISIIINTDNTLRLIQRSSTTDNSYSTSTIPQNTWTHIVVARSSSEVKFYINGELDNAVSNTFTPNSGGNQPILIGTNGTTTPTYFNGKIGQVRTYSSELTQAQIRQNFNFTKPGYPNGFNGTISGASFLPSAVSFDFDGNNDYVSLDSNFRAAFDKPNRSMTMWIKWDGKSTGFGMPFFMTGAGLTNGRFAVQLNHTTAQLNVFVGDAGSYPQATLTANTWTLISVVQSSNSYEVFVNDTSIGTATNNNYTATSTATSHIGSYLNTNHYWSGEISDVKFYSRTLTDAEVTAEYNLGYNGIG